jgi:hypothetical protein
MTSRFEAFIFATLHASFKTWTLWGYQHLIALTDILLHLPLHLKRLNPYSHTSVVPMAPTTAYLRHNCQSTTAGLTNFIEAKSSDHPDPFQLDTPFVPQPTDCTLDPIHHVPFLQHYSDLDLRFKNLP